MTSTDEQPKISIDSYLEENSKKLVFVLEGEREIIDKDGNVKKVLVQIYNEKPYTYTESRKKSNQKYIENNKEKVNEHYKKVYREKYQNDPEFREKEIERTKKYRERKKSELKEKK